MTASHAFVAAPPHQLSLHRVSVEAHLAADAVTEEVTPSPRASGIRLSPSSATRRPRRFFAAMPLRTGTRPIGPHRARTSRKATPSVTLTLRGLRLIAGLNADLPGLLPGSPRPREQQRWPPAPGSAASSTPDPAADARPGRPLGRERGEPGDGQLCRLPGRQLRVPAQPLPPGDAGLDDRDGCFSRPDAADDTRHVLVRAAPGRRVHQRARLRPCRRGASVRTAPGRPAPDRLGIRRYRCGDRALGTAGPGRARGGDLAYGVVDRGRPDAAADRGLMENWTRRHRRRQARRRPALGRIGGSPHWRSATPSKVSATLSPALSSSPPSPGTPRAGSAQGPGSSSDWPPSPVQHCGWPRPGGSAAPPCWRRP